MQSQGGRSRYMLRIALDWQLQPLIGTTEQAVSLVARSKQGAPTPTTNPSQGTGTSTLQSSGVAQHREHGVGP